MATFPSLAPDQPVDVRNVVEDSLPTAVKGRPGRYSLVINEGWRVLYAFGGMTMAAALRAATIELDRGDLDLISADATYCQAIPAGPVAIDVEVLRRGKRGAQVLVRMWATDEAADSGEHDIAGNDLVVTAVFGSRRESPYVLSGVTMPADAGTPESARERQPSPEPSPFDHIPYHHQTDWRLAVGRSPSELETGPSDTARTVSWFKFQRSAVRADGTWEPSVMAVPGDVLGPAVVEGLGRSDGFFLIISLQISLQWFAPIEGEWLCQHTRAHVAADGFATGSAELWSEVGTLVGLATQTALLQPMKLG